MGEVRLRTDFNENAAQGNHRLHCSVCGREVYDSLAQKCPLNGFTRCVYCCRRICAEIKPVENGWKCTNREAAKAASR